jgi:predicted O-linked N-acetylglucosamine transferase (SPINDLY family)
MLQLREVTPSSKDVSKPFNAASAAFFFVSLFMRLSRDRLHFFAFACTRLHLFVQSRSCNVLARRMAPRPRALRIH